MSIKTEIGSSLGWVPFLMSARQITYYTHHFSVHISKPILY